MISIKDLKTDKLGNLTSLITRGISPKYSEGEGYLVLNQKCIRDNRINIELARNYDKNQRVKKGCILEVGDVLINSTGIGTLSRSAIVKDVSENMTLDSHVTLVRTKKDIADAKYIGYHVELLEPVIENFAGGSTGQTELSRKDVYNLDIVIHELPTQQRIASILSAYDDLIEVNNQRIKLLEQTARELYKEWFVRMRFPGYKQAKFKKGIPEGWREKPINAVVKFLSGYSFKSTTYKQNGKFGIVTIKNVQDGHFINDCTDFIDELPKNLKEYSILKTGDVLMSLTGNVGRVCHVIGDNILLNQRVAKLKPLISDKTHYIYCFFRENSMIQYMENISLGSTAQMNLSPIQLGKQKVIVPDSPLVKVFDEMVDPYFQNKYQLIRANQMLREISDRLLPRLISGKLKVKETNNKKAVMA